MLISSTRPFGNSRTSSGLRKSLRSAWLMRPTVGERMRVLETLPPRQEMRRTTQAWLERGDQPLGCGVEARGLAVGAREHHRTLERGQDDARQVERGPLELEGAALAALLEHR